MCFFPLPTKTPVADQILSLLTATSFLFALVVTWL